MRTHTEGLSEMAREALMWLVRLNRRFGEVAGAFDLDLGDTPKPTNELPHDPMYQALQELEQRGLVCIEADEFMVQAWTFAVYLTDQGKAVAQDASFIDAPSPTLFPYPQP